VNAIRSRLQRQFWDAHSRGWDRIRSDAANRARLTAVVDRFAGQLPSGGKVADLGCGTGHYAVELAVRGFEVIAIDYAPAMLARARIHAHERSAPIEFRACDLNEDLPIAAETLDGALCVSLIQVVDDPRRLLARLRVALRPGGLVLIESVRHLGALSPGEHLSGVDQIINRVKKLVAKVPGAVKDYKPEDVTELCVSAGLQVAGTHVYDATFTTTARHPQAPPPTPGHPRAG
jgi:SAM-dependent methyltransferase